MAVYYGLAPSVRVSIYPSVPFGAISPDLRLIKTSNFEKIFLVARVTDTPFSERKVMSRSHGVTVFYNRRHNIITD